MSSDVVQRQEQIVIEAARKIERGCDCEYDHRCGRCQAVVRLIEEIKTLDKIRQENSEDRRELRSH